MPSEFARGMVAQRKAIGSEVSVTVGTSVGEVIGHNPKRIAIIFGGDFTNAVFVSTQSGIAAASGFPVTVTGGTLRFTLDEIGGLIQKAWFASANNAGAKLTIMESTLDENELP